MTADDRRDDTSDGGAAEPGASDPWADEDDGWPDGGDPWGEDPRVQAGIDHLQRAAREVIAASRSLLDVAEDLVEDPRSLGRLAGLLGTVGDLASRATRPPPPGGSAAPGSDDAGGDDPPVQRIPIS